MLRRRIGFCCIQSSIYGSLKQRNEAQEREKNMLEKLKSALGEILDLVALRLNRQGSQGTEVPQAAPPKKLSSLAEIEARKAQGRLPPNQAPSLPGPPLRLLFRDENTKIKLAEALGVDPSKSNILCDIHFPQIIKPETNDAGIVRGSCDVLVSGLTVQADYSKPNTYVVIGFDNT
jgi:hypothetical protein